MKYVIFYILIFILAMFITWYETLPEQMYAGRHDLHCEKTLHGKPCKCYERLVRNYNNPK